MVKSAMNMLATNKQFKNGLLTGMVLAKKIADDKKAVKGGKRIKGGAFDFKKVLAVAAGPLGWVWLARHKNDQELEEMKKQLEKIKPPPPTSSSKPSTKKEKEKEKMKEINEEDIDFPDVDDDDEELPMEEEDDLGDEDFDDFDPEDFE